MRWRFWFIEIPAKAISAWFLFYWTLLTVLAVLAFATGLATVVLDRFGIRWGW